MWAVLVAVALLQTRVIDDPFEKSVVYMTELDSPAAKGQAAYMRANECSFLQVSNRAFASSRERGAKDASSFFEFRLTALYRSGCGSGLEDVDVTQGRYIGGLEADVDVLKLSSNCAITMCKDEYSISTRLTAGLASRNEEVLIKYGAPHGSSIVVGFPIKKYFEHRGDVLR